MEKSKLPFDQIREIVHNIVSTFLDSHYSEATYFGEFYFNDGEKVHIVNTGSEILMRRWNALPWKSGSFVEAFVSNDLMKTFANADATNKKAILFYTLLVSNIGMPAAIL